ILVALLARGHLLVEGVPGLAKTLSVKTVAQAITGDFKRIQFTPDLVPADLVGTRIYNQRTGDFQTSLGPVFTNLLLADEINRAPADGRPGDDHRASSRASARGRRRLRRSAAHGVRRAHRLRDAPAGRLRTQGPGEVRELRGEPARLDQPHPHRARSRVPPRAGLRLRPGHPGPRPGRDPPPPRAEL